MPSIKELRNICQHSKEAPSRHSQSFEGRFNRLFSIYLTWFFIKLKIPPTPINILGTLVYLGGSSLFIFNRLYLQIIGFVLMFLSFILDACDGELARYYGMAQSKKGLVGGAYIEPVSHDIMYSFYFLPLGAGVSLAAGNLYGIIAAFIATSGKLLFRLIECRYDVLQEILKKRFADSYFIHAEIEETPKNAGYIIYRNFFTGTGLFFMLIIAAVLKHIDWYLYFYAASFLLFWFYKMARQWRKIKKLS